MNAPVTGDKPTLPANVETSDTAKVSALSARALGVGVICVAITCVVVCYAELVVGKIQIGFLQMPPVVVGMLVLLLGTRAALTRLSPRLRLKTHELFTIYAMMLLASMVSSRGLLEKLIPVLIVPNYFATPENGWKGKFFSWIPKWAVPWDPHGGPKQFVSARFYDALKPGEHIPWHLWILPLCAWAIFVALLLFSFLCLATILRRQWVDNEKLTFPLVQLPLEMIKGESTFTSRAGTSSGFLSNGLTWFGFAVPALVFGLKGLHQYAPSIPDIVTDIDVNSFFPNPPYNQLGFTHMYCSFAAVGFFYLLPTDLLFSLWFFFIFTRVEDVLLASWGYQPPDMPLYDCKAYQAHQIMGCYFVLVGYMLYTARPHLKRVWQAAFHGLFGYRQSQTVNREEDEVLPYRVAVWGLLASILLMAAWLRLLSVAYWLALLDIVIGLFVISLVMARSSCEAGMLMTETSFRPIDVYAMVGDPRDLGAPNLTGLAFLDAAWLRDQRGLIMTGFLDAMKFSDGVRVRRRSLLGVLALALLVALGVSGYLHIMLPYKFGAVNMYSYVYRGNPNEAFDGAASVLGHLNPPASYFDRINFLIGAGATMVMTTLRTRLAWFPFHPLGYALSGSWGMIVFWFPCLVAWLLKTFILRYGGMKLYARLRPFFLGMVLGEFTTAILFTLPALYNRFTPTPDFPWP